MNTKSLKQVKALNIFTLTTIQRIGDEDISDAMLAFGISSEVVIRIIQMTQEEIATLAETPRSLFSFNVIPFERVTKGPQSGQGYGVVHDSIISIAEVSDSTEEGV